jgi:hypothetical protein
MLGKPHVNLCEREVLYDDFRLEFLELRVLCRMRSVALQMGCIHATVLRFPFFVGGISKTVLASYSRYLHASIGILDNGHYLGLGESVFSHPFRRILRCQTPQLLKRHREGETYPVTTTGETLGCAIDNTRPFGTD